MPSARIHLPLRDITTIILFDETTTAQLIILRAIDKLKNALGDELNPVNLGLCTKTGALIDNDKILMQDDSIKLDIDRGQQPNLKIIHLEDKAPPNTASSGVVVEKRLSRSISSYGNGNNNLILKNTMLSSEQMKRRSFSCSTITSAGASTRNDLIQDENERPSVIGLSQIMRNTHLRTRESNGIYRCEKFNVTIIIGDNSRLLMEVDAYESITSIKSRLQALTERNNLFENNLIGYKTPSGGFVELFDEWQPFCRISILDYWRMQKTPFTLLLQEKTKVFSKQRQLFTKKLGAVIGFGLYRFEYQRDQEIDIFRRRMVNIRKQEQEAATASCNNNLHPYLDQAPLTDYLMEILGSINYRLHIRIHLPHNSQIVKTFVCKYDDTPAAVLEAFVPKNQKSLLASPSDYVLKLCGSAEYLIGNNRLIDFVAIRNLVLRSEKINVVLVPIQDLRSDSVDSGSSSGGEDFNAFEDFPIEDCRAYFGTHAELSVEGKLEEEIKSISLWDIAKTFRLQIIACDNLQVGTVESVYVEAGLYHGDQLLCPTQRTHQIVPGGGDNLRWGAWINFDIAYYNIPRNAQLCVTVWGRWNLKKRLAADKPNDSVPLGASHFLLMDFRGALRSGMHRIPLATGEKANPIGPFLSSSSSQRDPVIVLRFDTFAYPVVYPEEEDKEQCSVGSGSETLESLAEQEKINAIISLDSLVKLEQWEREFVWSRRLLLRSRPEALAKVLLSCTWSNLDQVVEMKRLLRSWSTPTPFMALELLEAYFPDLDVRQFAVGILESLQDHQLLDVLQQLVQVLKFEPYIDGPLIRFLIRRSLRNAIVGHYFYWHLKAEIDSPSHSLRFALYLESFLRGSAASVEEMIRQTRLLGCLSKLSTCVKRSKPSERKLALQTEIESCDLRDLPGCKLPLDPRFAVAGIDKDKFRFMDSKKLPIWCVFNNADSTGQEILCIFKSGDDLRQDMLTIQMIKIMDKLWQQENLFMHMTTYGCISTGEGTGMIEVVRESETVSNIQVAFGGSTAAFRDQPLAEWLRKYNPDEGDYRKAVDIFTKSCAGYCVATYVLGIGDRHNDNIMLSKSGNLFHIDYGHFLGNIKKKFGIKRERAPFVLTPDFAYVIGKKDSVQFKEFVELCIKAYLIVRKSAKLFINLFSMMLSTGIPELKSAEDLCYLRESLCLGKTEEEAAEVFRGLIHESLRLGWSTQLNWWLHNLAHAK